MEIDDKVADFTLQDDSEKTIHLERFRRQAGGLFFFYPKADTPGCHHRGLWLPRSVKKIQNTGAIVLASPRHTESAEEISGKVRSPVPPPSDVDETVCKQFDVLKEKNMYGKTVLGIERTTFLIGPDQRCSKSSPKVEARRPR